MVNNNSVNVVPSHKKLTLIRPAKGNIRASILVVVQRQHKVTIALQIIARHTVSVAYND